MLTYADAGEAKEAAYNLRTQTEAYARQVQSLETELKTREAQVTIRQHASAYVSMRQHTSAELRDSSRRERRRPQHTSAYVSIRQHTYAPPSDARGAGP
jgi:hypothetical protein